MSSKDVIQVILKAFSATLLDPRERIKEDDLEVVLSPQRRSFGGGCQVAPAALTRRPISPLENKENESLRLGGTRRIGSGRIMAVRGFERDIRVDKERDRERERDFKDKRFRVLCKITVHILWLLLIPVP